LYLTVIRGERTSKIPLKYLQPTILVLLGTTCENPVRVPSSLEDKHETNEQSRRRRFMWVGKFPAFTKRGEEILFLIRHMIGIIWNRCFQFAQTPESLLLNAYFYVTFIKSGRTSKIPLIYPQPTIPVLLGTTCYNPRIELSRNQ